MSDLVSVICIVPEFFKSQILLLYRQFRAQTYPNKELIIYETGKKSDLIEKIISKDIRVNYAYTSENISQGKEINEMRKMAKGKIIVHFKYNHFYLNNYIQMMVKILNGFKLDFIKFNNWRIFSLKTKSFFQFEKPPKFEILSCSSSNVYRKKIKIDFDEEDRQCEYTWNKTVESKFKTRFLSGMQKDYFTELYTRDNPIFVKGMIEDNKFKPDKEIISSINFIEKFFSSIEEIQPITKDNQMVLDFPDFKNEDLPKVSILTVTKNRENFLEMAKMNWKKFLYPREKLEWVIIDDSDKANKDFENIENIRYFHSTGGDYDNLADKRNYGVEKCNYDYIIIMDDDDYYYADSILAKVKTLITKNKSCVFTSPIATYNIVSNKSQIQSAYSELAPPEATLAFTKEFWEKGKFEDNKNFGEGNNMIIGREKEVIKIPFLFNCICFTHKTNTTGKLRNLEIELNEKFQNFYELFDEDIKNVINKIRENI